MAAENLPRVSPRLSSKPPLSPSPSPLPRNGNPNNSASKASSASSSSTTMSNLNSLRRSPRLRTDQESNGGKSLEKPNSSKKQKMSDSSKKKKRNSSDVVSFLIGDPVPDEEARRRWPWRYMNEVKRIKGGSLKSNDDEDKLVLNVKCHYSQAEIEKVVFDLGDCAYVKVNLKPKSIPPCDFYYDMKYSVDYSTFCTMEIDSSYLYPSPPMRAIHMNNTNDNFEGVFSNKPYKSELALLDVYSGCGGMSTGLCYGAKVCGVDLVTKWAIDIDKSACESLKLNHPTTQIRNESAEDFLDLLNEWNILCKQYVVSNASKTHEPNSIVKKAAKKDVNSKNDHKTRKGEYEVASLVDICYGDPNETGKRGLHFQVRWVGYGSSEDTWESIKGLSKCQDRIRDFVLKGFKRKILPCPGDVDVICGGPPCQGISGYNRFRNVGSPLDDERNRQIVVFMDIVNFLKPKFVLMENVIDILRFAKGTLGRYALSRLVRMNYQARLGIMAAGCYGLPQFRLRVFLWGAHSHEKLPQFPLPTHDVVLKYGAPREFERCVVAYDEGQSRELEKALVLSDAICDLPPVSNHEIQDKMSYKKPPETEFQKYIRVTKCDMMGSASCSTPITEKSVLRDHRPLPLGEDDYLRVCRIPRRKVVYGANFRDLPGIIVGADNVVQRDLTVEPILMPSGKPLVPDYAINFCDGKSTRPFSRLWWDETVPTLLCRPDLHSQSILHPEQDRVLTIRECARLQGFPDYYEFCGSVKERYCQVGNAVAIPVARALGFALGMAVRKLTGDEPIMTLPPKFSHSTASCCNRHPI
ncbi:DNA (cytosine-5)-methyltransferase CMT2-like isoform X6 [Camellia sinensis]|uniref:DNA (cytosine-5)-methyltransferase CMT2-like isoform X6 n=1 Tax=Camellia sinensis TaxID=4442 RepID=UPI0010358CC9|nr:DNA (cytosine-5)-methyltransferase CMT2-like isoform X6 [Camellia sinensis]